MIILPEIKLDNDNTTYYTFKTKKVLRQDLRNLRLIHLINRTVKEMHADFEIFLIPNQSNPSVGSLFIVEDFKIK